MVFDPKNQTPSYFILCLQEKFARKAIARTGRFQSAQRLCVGCEQCFNFTSFFVFEREFFSSYFSVELRGSANIE